MKRCLACLGTAFLLLVLALVAFILFAAEWLVAPDAPPQASDAVVVLGGDNGSRLLLGLDLHRKGMAPTLVLTGSEEDALETRPTYISWRRQFLIDNGVPSGAILFEHASRNSREEAAAVRKMAEARGWKTITVVSDPPHLRRLTMVWGRAFRGSPATLRFTASKPRWWKPERWWADSRSAQFVIMEYIKYVHNALQ